MPVLTMKSTYSFHFWIYFTLYFVLKITILTFHELWEMFTFNRNKLHGSNDMLTPLVLPTFLDKSNPLSGKI